jgi:hypothetical protein
MSTIGQSALDIPPKELKAGDQHSAEDVQR